MGSKERQCGRRDAVDAPGMADSPRPMRLQLMADLVRETGHGGIVDIVSKNEAFVAPIGIDVGGLAAEIDLVFRVDFELPRDLGIKLAKNRPNPRQIVNNDIRIG